jgi:hypothetical protein
MSLFSKIFKKKEIQTYQDFWDWFLAHEKTFYDSIIAQKDIVDICVTPIMEKLQMLDKRFYCQVGKAGADKAELVITPEGDIKHFVFTEAFVQSAPNLPNWLFTHLKQPVSEGVSIRMNGYVFNKETVSFYYDINPDYPDEIDIHLVHKDYNKEADKTIKTGCFVLLDTLLGEFNSTTLIDAITIEETNKSDKDLVSIAKLNDFIVWREKEFVEKYQLTLEDEETYDFTQYKFTLENDLVVIGMINTTFLDIEAKPSHPWMLVIEIDYISDNDRAMPDDETLELLNNFVDELAAELPTSKGYLNLGRETGNNNRTVYFACKEFNLASKITHTVMGKYADRLNITYDIYKDKYWMTMNKFLE